MMKTSLIKVPKLNNKIRYNRFLLKICKLYDCNKNEAAEWLQNAFMDFLSPLELEKYYFKDNLKEIMKQELKLNKKYQK